MFFIDMLHKEGINEIEVPLLEVLNYDYHAMFGEKTKNKFNKAWSDLTDLTEDELFQYEIEKANYDRFVDKEDKISENKTDYLAKLFYRIEEQFDTISIGQSDNRLIVKIKIDEKKAVM